MRVRKASSSNYNLNKSSQKEYKAHSRGTSYSPRVVRTTKRGIKVRVRPTVRRPTTVKSSIRRSKGFGKK